MKLKFLKSTILLAILGLTFAACNKKEVEPKQEEHKIQITDFDRIGELHNEGLDYVYDKLVNLKRENAKVYSQEDILILSNEFTIDYYETIKSDNYFEDANQLITDCFFNMDSQEKLYTSSLNLSNSLTSLLDNLDEIVNNKMLKINEATILIQKLESQASKNLSNDDMRIFYSASSVARYTMRYWNSNLNKWKELLNYSERSWYGDAAGADVAGAVGAAVATAVVNALPGPGQVAYGAAIVGGAVGGSVGSAVYSLWGWITK